MRTETQVSKKFFFQGIADRGAGLNSIIKELAPRPQGQVTSWKLKCRMNSSFGAQDTPLLAAGRNAQGKLDKRYSAACCGWVLHSLIDS